jgi:hypothetical protein
MPIPQVNDRIKEAPVVVLRAVFAGIGQILLTADKVRARAAEQVWTPDRPPVPGPRSAAPGLRSAAPGPRNGTTHAEPAVAEHSAIREAPVSPPPAPAAKTTPATKPAPAAKTTPAAKPAPATKPASATKAAPATKTTRATKPAPKAAPAPKTVPAPRAPKADPVVVEPPLPGWDGLSLASLRARLRGFDAPTIRAMLAYEQAHARREPVITMLERRLAKITAG